MSSVDIVRAFGIGAKKITNKSISDLIASHGDISASKAKDIVTFFKAAPLSYASDNFTLSDKLVSECIKLGAEEGFQDVSLKQIEVLLERVADLQAENEKLKEGLAKVGTVVHV